MVSLDTILWIISIVLSAATLIAMVFGFRLGRKALTKNMTLYGDKAKKHYAFLKDNILKGRMPERYVYGGGKITTPQLKVEKMTYDEDTMPVEWKKFTKQFQFYDNDQSNPSIIQVEEWRV